MSKKIYFFPIIFVVFVMLVGLACGFSKKGDPTATPQAMTVEIPKGETATKEPAVEVPPAGEGKLTLLPNLTFFQDDEKITSVFFLRNDYSNEMLMDIEYKVVAYDANGAEVQDTSNYIGYLAPGETTGLVDEFWVDDGVIVNSINIDLVIGDRSTEVKANPFRVDKTKAYISTNWTYLTGVLYNTDNVTYTFFKVAAIAFDEAGSIIGGGYSYVGFVPDGDKVGVDVMTNQSVTPARIEFYPQRASYGEVYERGDWWNNVEVVDFGYVLDGSEVGGGMFLKNVTDELIEGSEFMMTVYDKDGYVCGITSGDVDYLWPEQTTGVSHSPAYIHENCEPDTVDLIVMPGEFSESELSGEPIVSDSAVFNYNEYWSTVTVMLRNTLNKSVSDVIVSVLLLDEDGSIIGGGKGWHEDFEALGTLEVEVNVTYARDTDPASIVVFPSIATWSEIGE